jgi:dihydropteroate synthase
MGIINVTPDSFSDGGIFFDPENAVEHGLRLIEEGADILDIGGESTRPGAEQVSEEEELRRVIPVIEKLAAQTDVAISIDTVKPEVARAAVDAGASIVNDIAANREDPGMWKLVAESGAGYIAMHMQGTPQTMQTQPTYENVVDEVYAFFEERMRRIQETGVKPEQIVFDPGIGFGKTIDHNLQLISELKKFSKLQRPLLLGASRKSFMGKLFDLPVDERLYTSIACACRAVENGVQLIRTHDVAATKQAIRMTEALLSARR